MNDMSFYLGHIEESLEYHKNAIKKIFLLWILISLPLIYLIYIYLSEVTNAKYYLKEQVRTYKELRLVEQEVFIKNVHLIMNIVKKFENYMQSEERIQNIQLLEKSYEEMIGLRKYVKSITNEIRDKNDDSLENSLEQLKKSVDRINLSISRIETDPFLNFFEIIYPELRDKIDMVIDTDDIRRGLNEASFDEEIKSMEKEQSFNKYFNYYAEKFETLKPSSQEIYLGFISFIFINFLLYYLYKFHNNQIIKYSYQKDLFIKAHMALEIKKRENMEIDDKEIFEKFFANIDLEVKQEEINQSPLTSLFKIFKS
jgi:hypothetical protein